jgi:hypothetical protein
MKIINMFICTAFVFLLGGVPGYAVDQSICSNDSNMVLADNGTLQSCTLGNDYQINGITCQQGYNITFYDTGDLQSCNLSEDATIDGIKCERDGPITFYRDGHMNTCIKVSE